MRLTAIKVTRVFDERIAVAGANRKLMTRAVQGQWKWILSSDQYGYYRDGSCPYS